MINNFWLSTKEHLSKRSFDSVVRKVMNQYNQGKVGNFRNYLATALTNRIEKLDFRRMKDRNKREMKQMKLERQQQQQQQQEQRSLTVSLPFYNWLES